LDGLPFGGLLPGLWTVCGVGDVLKCAREGDIDVPREGDPATRRWCIRERRAAGHQFEMGTTLGDAAEKAQAIDSGEE